MSTINKITREDVEEFKRTLMNVDWDNALDAYQDVSGKSAFYPGKGTPLGLMYCALKGSGEVGEFNEHLGKAMRDDAFGQTTCDVDSNGVQASSEYDVPLTVDRKLHLFLELGDELWYLARKAEELGYTLSQVALGNLEKLCSRSERDTLRGSGDDR